MPEVLTKVLEGLSASAGYRRPARRLLLAEVVFRNV